MTENIEKIISTICSTHCGGICLLKVHVADGTITKIETDDGKEPQLRACLKGRAMRQRVYAPDRLKHPLKRTGKRGDGKFERITWDEALETIASELKRVRETYGPAAILLRGGGGDVSLIHGGVRPVPGGVSIQGSPVPERTRKPYGEMRSLPGKMGGGKEANLCGELSREGPRCWPPERP